ncbi:hypothetical protein EJB05_15280 [Eragrostis curvula]|uniref:Uncharacterized protein n=1 Tax=Eragrostis curvula TaxID=38414 RepID=A0A5J9W1G3_9POAL|nr:hypothetical protein EJB05_15280 [Eragrostis curvula]
MKWQMVKIKIPKRREMEELARRIDANVRAAAALMVKRYQIVRAARELVRKEEELLVNPLAVADARARLRALVTAAADLPAKLAATLSDQRKRRASRSLKLKRVTAKQVRARLRLRAQRRAMLKKAEELVAEIGADLGVLVDATADFTARPGIAADLMRDWLDDN